MCLQRDRCTVGVHSLWELYHFGGKTAENGKTRILKKHFQFTATVLIPYPLLAAFPYSDHTRTQGTEDKPIKGLLISLLLGRWTDTYTAD